MWKINPDRVMDGKEKRRIVHDSTFSGARNKGGGYAAEPLTQREGMGAGEPCTERRCKGTARTRTGRGGVGLQWCRTRNKGGGRGGIIGGAVRWRLASEQSAPE